MSFYWKSVNNIGHLLTHSFFKSFNSITLLKCTFLWSRKIPPILWHERIGSILHKWVVKLCCISLMSGHIMLYNDRSSKNQLLYCVACKHENDVLPMQSLFAIMSLSYLKFNTGMQTSQIYINFSLMFYTNPK